MNVILLCGNVDVAKVEEVINQRESGWGGFIIFLALFFQWKDLCKAFQRQKSYKLTQFCDYNDTLRDYPRVIP